LPTYKNNHYNYNYNSNSANSFNSEDRETLREIRVRLDELKSLSVPDSPLAPSYVPLQELPKYVNELLRGVCVYIYVCVCVCARERERERVSVPLREIRVRLDELKSLSVPDSPLALSSVRLQDLPKYGMRFFLFLCV
jgi:hypothetical protein